MQTEPLLIGIDGGATKVSAWEIVYNKSNSTFLLGKVNSTISYRELNGYIPDFIPVDINIQLNERISKISCTKEEQQQAAVYVEACSLAIHEIVKKTGRATVMIGIGMPGLKTDDKRGIAVVANGPRMTDYSDLLEKRLKSLNINLALPVNHLGSDADYCGIGENYSQDGLFRNFSDAYYLGGGTGVADAMKLNGELVTFDNSKSWIAKTWEMKSIEGISLERVTSVSGIQKTYAEFAGKSLEELNQKNTYPVQISDLAKNGDEAAVKTYQIVNQNLARLLYERIVTLNIGWQKLFEFVNPNKPELLQKHSYSGKVFETIVIGQRLGELFDYETGAEIVKKPVLNQLNSLIQNSAILPDSVKSHYQNLNTIIKTSKLREAPALGAGIDAFLTNDE
jgi:predicted NBD/HSP70 family sugar kinase